MSPSCQDALTSTPASASAARLARDLFWSGVQIGWNAGLRACAEAPTLRRRANESAGEASLTRGGGRRARIVRRWGRLAHPSFTLPISPRVGCRKPQRDRPSHLKGSALRRRGRDLPSAHSRAGCEPHGASFELRFCGVTGVLRPAPPAHGANPLHGRVFAVELATFATAPSNAFAGATAAFAVSARQPGFTRGQLTSTANPSGALQ
jgi:hypothetical protein